MDKEQLAKLWFERSLAHIEECRENICAFYDAFVDFLYDEDVSYEQWGKWVKEAIQKENEDETSQ